MFLWTFLGDLEVERVLDKRDYFWSLVESPVIVDLCLACLSPMFVYSVEFLNILTVPAFTQSLN